MQVLPLLSGVIGELDLGGHDCESHYDLRCVDVNCSNWRSHSDIACSVFVSLLHRHVQILLGVEEECNMASPSKCTSLLSLLQPLSLLVIPFLHSSTSHRVKNSSSLPPSSYEFPNGYNQSFTVEKFKLCEGLFDSSTPNLKVQQPVTGFTHILDLVIYIALMLLSSPSFPSLCRVFMVATCWLFQRSSLQVLPWWTLTSDQYVLCVCVCVVCMCCVFVRVCVRV